MADPAVPSMSDACTSAVEGSVTVKTVQPGRLSTPDAAAVRLDDGGDDGEPEPGAARGPRARVVAAGEPVEDVRQQVAGDAGAVVGHGEHRAARGASPPAGR